MNFYKEETMKNKKLFIGNLVMIFIAGFISMILVDEGNRMDLTNDKSNLFLAIIQLFKIDLVNITSKTWLMLTCTLGILFCILVAFCLWGEKLKTKKIKILSLVGSGVIGIGFVFIFGLLINISFNRLFVKEFIYGLLSFIIFGGLIMIAIYGIIYLVKVIFLPTSKKTMEKDNEEIQHIENGENNSLTLKPQKAMNLFPGLDAIDKKYETQSIEPVIDDKLSLNEIVLRFQSYLSNEQNLYFDLPILRGFIAGMSASRLIILEGLSGTGKSSLPRYFAKFINVEAFFAPVQATWRDRSDILGYYNDFSKSFKETNFLKQLYEANYRENDINIMVLDEMNLSRVEYYFADFLSVLEYPSESWKINLMQLKSTNVPPKKLVDGMITIPENTWFFGTANKDDSTFIITDKVYDRAVVLNFEDRNEKIETKVSSKPIHLSSSKLNQLFKEAIENKENNLSAKELKQFLEIVNFTFENLEITFGNRIMNQIKIMVPVYVSLGGSKEEALDLMFSQKVLNKLNGRYEDFIKDGLMQLQTLINKTYGKNVFVKTEMTINKMLKKLI